jgi:hypothetical protein
MVQCTIAMREGGWISMNDIVDLALNDYQLSSPLSSAELAVCRARTAQYIGTLMSAGQDDPRQLEEYARAYLRELHEGPDRRFTGC